MNDVQFHPDGKHVLSASFDGTTKTWDKGAVLPALRIQLVADPVQKVVLTWENPEDTQFLLMESPLISPVSWTPVIGAGPDHYETTVRGIPTRYYRLQNQPTGF